MSIIDVTNNYLNKLRKGLVSRKLFARRKPTIAQNADGTLELFAVGLDGHLYHIWQTTKNNGSEWSE